MRSSTTTSEWQKIVGHASWAISGRANSANVSDSRITWVRARSAVEELDGPVERPQPGDHVGDRASSSARARRAAPADPASARS